MLLARELLTLLTVAGPVLVEHISSAKGMVVYLSSVPTSSFFFLVLHLVGGVMLFLLHAAVVIMHALRCPHGQAG